jgi:hypothetical protein
MSKSKEVLYSTANDEDGILVFARSAPKGRKYFCSHCNGEMILRRKDNSKVRPHFAHKSLTETCTPETVLHKNFKQLLYNRIQKSIKNNVALAFEWSCTECGEVHQGNLIKKAKRVYIERNLEQCIPDILIYDNADKPYIAIEIVVTHEPEEQVIKYYEENDIILVLFKLDSDEDLDLINRETLNPRTVDFCINPKCDKCGNRMNAKYICIGAIDCWKCHRPMKASWIEARFEVFSPEDFTLSELDYARNNGVIIKKVTSKTLDGEQYLANVCSHCGAFIGSFFISNYLGEGDSSVRCGHICMNCTFDED